jgi:hypothetical protein
MLKDPVVVALVRDCQHFRLSLAVVGREVGRDAAPVRKDEVGSQVVLLSAVEGLVELFVWVQTLHGNQSRSESKQTTFTYRLREYRGETSRPAKT